MTDKEEIPPALDKTPNEEVISVKAQKRYEDDILKWKSEYKVTKEELETIKAKTDSEKLELASRVENTTKEKQMFEAKYIQAEVKAHAVAAGIKDIEFVKLIDLNEVKLDEKGEIVGVDKAISDLKTRKPDWFGSDKKTSSSTNANFPDKSSEIPKVDARKLTKEEWKQKKTQFMTGQF